MFIDPSAGLKHIEQCCALRAPKAFLGSRKAHLLRLVSPALRQIPLALLTDKLALLERSGRSGNAVSDQPPTISDPDAPALLTFTSGSTGQPKAALRSHRFLLAQHSILEKHFVASPGDVSLATLPIFVLADLASGVTSLIAAGNLRKPGSIDPAPVLAQIERYCPLRAGASPAFWERIISHCQQHKQPLSHLRYIYAGGAPVFPPLLDRLQKLAPQAEVTAVYGSTEAEPIAHIARSQIRLTDAGAMLQGQGLLAGVPVPELGVRILHEQWGQSLPPMTIEAFAAQCMPAGAAGEIVVCGAHVLPGYVDGRGDEETKFRVEGQIWHRTGDLGYFDTDGRLWLLGRCTARIEDRRGILYPFAVECAVSAHDAVRRAAVVSLNGQRVLALELKRQLRQNDQLMLKKMVAWAGIDQLRIYAHLPVDRRHNAKIDYPALKKLLAR